MININEASKRLGVKVRTVRQWIHDGRLPAKKYKTNGRWYIDEAEVEKVIVGDENDNKD